MMMHPDIILTLEVYVLSCHGSKVTISWRGKK